MASLSQWTSVWINSRSWWWTGRPGILQSMGSESQTQLSDWTELLLGRKAIATLYSMLKGRATTLLTKVCIVKYLVLPVVTYGCDSWDHKEAWTLKSWSFSLEVLEKTLESPLDDKEIKEVNPKDQPWTFTARSAAEAPILWPPDANSQRKGEDLDAGKAGGQEKRATEDEMVGWYHRIQGIWVWANSGRQWRIENPSVLQFMGSHRVLDMTYQLNYNSTKELLVWSVIILKSNGIDTLESSLDNRPWTQLSTQDCYTKENNKQKKIII